MNESKTTERRSVPINERPMAYRIAALCLGIAAFFGLERGLHYLRDVPTINTLTTYIRNSGIDAGAIYYTEVDETADADVYMRSTFGRH